MLKLSLMTINMMMPVFVPLMLEQDLEEALELYNEMMDLVQDAGYEAVDVTDIELSSFGVDTVKDVLNNHHLNVSSIIHFGKFASMDEKESEELIQKAKEMIDLADNFDSKVVMLVPQAQDNITEYTREELADSLIRNWIPIVAYAKERGIHVVIEDTPDLKLPLCTTEELQYVLERVPGLEVVYDSGNMILVDEDPVEYFDTFSEKTGHIHLKDMMVLDPSTKQAEVARDGRKMIAAPSGTGLLDFKTLLDHIKKSDYDGYLTVEFAKDADLEYRDSLKRAKAYFNALL